MNHPSSAGLRKLADFLDNCVEEGIEVPPPQFVYFSAYAYVGDKSVQSATCAALAKRLSLPIKMQDADKNYAGAVLNAMFGDVPVDFHFHASAICEQVEVMRPVKVWKCGGVEVKAEDAANG